MIPTLLALLTGVTGAFASTLYIGSYSSKIVRVHIAPDGRMQYIGQSPSELNPSWLTFNSKGDQLFAVSEVGDYSNPDYPGSGAMSSFAVQEDGSLQLINTVASGGSSPAHAAMDITDSCLYVSNYCAGTIGVVRVDTSSGVLSPPSQVLDHNPTPVSDCQGAHIHEVVLGGANRTSLEVMDLGLNTVSHYSTTAQLIDMPALQVVSMPSAGSGPRHMAVHPFAPWAFVLNELDSTVSSLPYEHLTGKLGEVSASVSSLPPEQDTTDMAAGELQLSRDGRFLYASNRDNSEPNLGRSSIAVFAVDAATGLLTALQFASSMGDHPRHFDLFYDGSLLVVANMNSDNIVSFDVNRTSGVLTPPPAAAVGRVLQTPRPTQVLLAPGS